MELVLGFVGAFLVCGVLSALFQLFMILTRLKPPVVLIIGFAIGAILVPFGVMASLEAFGQAGMSITVMGAGGAMCGALLELFGGSALPLITVTAIFLSLMLIGLIAGILRNIRQSE